MRILTAFAALFMLAASPVPAQGLRIMTDRMIGSGTADGVAVLDDGSVVVVGRAGNAPRVLRFDARWRVQDDWTLPGSDAWPRAAAALPGAVAVVAGPADPPGYERGIAVWRLALDGDGRLRQDWLRRFRRTALDGGTGAVALDDGGLVVTGWSGGKGGAGAGGWVLRLGADGEAAWRRMVLPFTEDGVFEASAAARAANGDVLVAAYGAPAVGEPGGVWVLRFDAAGKDYAQKVVDELADEHPQALAAFADNGFALAGWATPPDEPDKRAGWLARVDGTGALAWERAWSEPGAAIEALAALPDGGMLVAGTQRGEGWLARIDAAGATQWERRLGGAGSRLAGLAVLPDGRAVAVGRKGRSQMWLLCLSY
jgi:hypothetical protein